MSRQNPFEDPAKLQGLLDSLGMAGIKVLRVEGPNFGGSGFDPMGNSFMGDRFDSFPSMDEIVAETAINMEGVIDTLAAMDQALLDEKVKVATAAGNSTTEVMEKHYRYHLTRIVEGNMTASGLRSQLKAAESRADNLEKRLFETTNSYLKASRYEARLDRLLGQIISSVGSEVRFTAEDIAKIIERVDKCEHVDHSPVAPLEPAHCCDDACCKYVKAELTMASDIKVMTETTTEPIADTETGEITDTPPADSADDNNTTGDNTNQQDDATSAAG